MTVRHLRWLPDTADDNPGDRSVRVWCPTCNWRKTGSLANVNRAAVAHVERHGHRVQLYRRQWKAISPVREEDTNAER